MEKEDFISSVKESLLNSVEAHIDNEIERLWKNKDNITGSNSRMNIINIDRSLKVVMFKDRYELRAWDN